MKDSHKMNTELKAQLPLLSEKLKVLVNDQLITYLSEKFQSKEQKENSYEILHHICIDYTKYAPTPSADLEDPENIMQTYI